MKLNYRIERSLHYQFSATKFLALAIINLACLFNSMHAQSSKGFLSKNATIENVLTETKNSMKESVDQALNVYSEPKRFLTNSKILTMLPEDLKNYNNFLSSIGFSEVADKQMAVISKVAKATSSRIRPVLMTQIYSLSASDLATFITQGKSAGANFLKIKTCDKVSGIVEKELSKSFDTSKLNNFIASFNKMNPLVERKKDEDVEFKSISGSDNKQSLEAGVREMAVQFVVDGLYGLIQENLSAKPNFKTSTIEKFLRKLSRHN